MSNKVKRDSNPANDYSDGYNSGRRYWTRKLKALFTPKKKRSTKK